jgi:hypothetical protein
MSTAVACSGGGSTPDHPAATSSTAGDHDAFAKCMTGNGPPAQPADVDQQTWDNARQACAWLAPAPPPHGAGAVRRSA